MLWVHQQIYRSRFVCRHSFAGTRLPERSTGSGGGINVEAEIAALVDSESLAKLDADQEQDEKCR